MQLSTGLTNVIEKRFSGDFKQDLIIKILELEGDLPMFITADDMHKWLSSIAINMSRNTHFQVNNQARIMEECADEIRRMYHDDT
ncbi:MAG: hypothetical protein V3T23_01440, partial [Nitrososphaerales archaeon]